MENKYYTPKLSEFCVGFDYETRVAGYDAEWISSTIYAKFEEGWESNLEEEISMYIDGANEFRVKYLDQQDIEDCGFVRSIIYDTDIYHLFTDIATREGNIDKIMYVLYKEFDNKYSIAKGYYLEGWPPPCADIILFHGDIKNKTELKKLLKMLGL